MYDELIKRLRGCANSNYCYSECPEDVNDKCQEHLMLQAADAIEELNRLHEAQRQNLITLMNEAPKME